MKYKASPNVPHDELNDLVSEHGDKGWVIHSILDVKSWQHSDLVTIIWEASPKTEVISSSHLTGDPPNQCSMNSHEFRLDHHMKETSCKHCGITIEEFINSNSPQGGANETHQERGV